MKLRLVIDVDVSLEALAYYEFQSLPHKDYEAPARTLFREAVSAWESEYLLVFGTEPVLVSATELSAEVS